MPEFILTAISLLGVLSVCAGWGIRFRHGGREGVPPPCKPDSVRPLRGWTAISLTPPERGAPLARSATITREL